eukprot:TRINITY_DN709_c1_g2_i1.p1 TRINITY_DN709_c1_g2~~TRINITY_DN709_c1_g2_i1.p1  ORF type:complete len:997 (+),score=340.08 TRINITY_DN709_c1_g2_i1:79-3069(+)
MENTPPNSEKKKKSRKKSESNTNQASDALAAFAPSGLWFENFQVLEQIEAPETKNDAKLVLDCKKRASSLLDNLTQKYESDTQKKKDNDQDFMKTVLSSGTVTDKLAAMTLQIQHAPLYTMKILDTLLAMAGKKGRRESMMAIESLKDLFMGNLLPDRPMISFHQRPLQSDKMTDNHLIAWYFEDQIKSRYSSFVKILDSGTHDTLVHYRESMIKCIFDLLCAKPEEEHFLLNVLVNKLGDLEKKIASKIIYLLTLILEQHPNMKIVIAREIENFLHRPNLSARAQYYSIIYLNQLEFNSSNAELAEKLISIYFSVFTQMLGVKQSKKSDGDKKEIVITKKKVDQRMLSALLTGVNRAFPFAKNKDSEVYNQYLDTLFTIIHISNFSKSSQALQLVWQVMHAQKNVSDRYYRAIYAKLFANDIFVTSKQTLFLNLLFKTMKNDTDINRVLSFIKRLLQICLYLRPNIVCGILFLISEVANIHPKIKDQLKSGDIVPLNNLATSWSTVEYLKEATIDKLGKIKATKVKVDTKQQTPSKKPDELVLDEDEDEDDDEDVEGNEDGGNGVDINNDDVELHQMEEETPQKEVKKAEFVLPKNFYKKNFDMNVKPIELGSVELSEYDPLKRDPKYANSEKTKFWELDILVNHYHPSVAKWAETVKKGQRVVYRGDPLRDFELNSFLDRLSYKKPKKDIKPSTLHAPPKTGSIMQSSYVKFSERSHPVNSKQFIEQNEQSVREDEMFFYKYFKQKQTLPSKDKKKKKDDVGGDDHEDDDEDDESGEGGNDDDDIPEEEINKILSTKLDADFWDDSEEEEARALAEMEGTDFPEPGAKQKSKSKGGDGDDGDDGDDDDGDEGGSDGDISFDYDKMGDDDMFDSDEQMFGSNSDDEGDKNEKMEDGEEGGNPSDFADLEEFAHLLENSGVNEDGGAVVKKTKRFGKKSGGTSNKPSSGGGSRKRSHSASRKTDFNPKKGGGGNKGNKGGRGKPTSKQPAKKKKKT